MNDVNKKDAIRVVESLRLGIPPEGHIAEFTVGRSEEIKILRSSLNASDYSALLVKANYGAGKSHLLKLLREEALSEGYVVALVTLDSNGGARFNRMDQIFGQVCRSFEVPGSQERSIRHLFDRRSHLATRNPNEKWMQCLSSNGKWDQSALLASPGLYVAVRAWINARNDGGRLGEGKEPRLDLIEDWLFQPWLYKNHRQHLFNNLIGSMRLFYRDPRRDNVFFTDGVFVFGAQGHRQSWDGVGDLHMLAQCAGYKGLILCFDEVEDILYNLNNIRYQQDAFRNLFMVFAGRLPTKCFFAVTPGFVDKCKSLLFNRGVYDYDFRQFDALRTFEMTPIGERQMFGLAEKILNVYQVAYTIRAARVRLLAGIEMVCRKKMASPVEDRVRQSIKAVVSYLDEAMEAS